MSDLLVALWPLFILIVAGYYLQRAGFPSEGFWPGAERFNYFVLFPALLLHSLCSAPLDNPALPGLLVAIVLVLSICGLAMLALSRFKRWPAARFGVFLQGVLRFNTYLGLAVVSSLYGKEGMLLATVVIALLVPAVNVLSVLALSAGRHTSVKSLFLPVAKNPLILACVAGVLLNLSGVQLRWGSDRLLTLLAAASLPLGLMCVGAALRPNELRAHLGALVGNSVARLLVVPSVALLCARLLALPPLETRILVVFFALPTASSSYLLTRQLGGDGRLMAGIITFQTLLSAASLLLVMAMIAAVG